MDERERAIVIGDVHGCLDELKALLKRCKWDPKRDRLVLVGDLVGKVLVSVLALTPLHILNGL
jgi:hypothetical protein